MVKWTAREANREREREREKKRDGQNDAQKVGRIHREIDEWRDDEWTESQ